MCELKDMVIISNYDCGYCRSYMVDGIILERGNHAFKLIDKMCDVLINKEDIERVQSYYRRAVLVCEDGCIEYYPYNGKVK